MIQIDTIASMTAQKIIRKLCTFLLKACFDTIYPLAMMAADIMSITFHIINIILVQLMQFSLYHPKQIGSWYLELFQEFLQFIFLHRLQPVTDSIHLIAVKYKGGSFVRKTRWTCVSFSRSFLAVSRPFIPFIWISKSTRS